MERIKIQDPVAYFQERGRARLNYLGISNPGTEAVNIAAVHEARSFAASAGDNYDDTRSAHELYQLSLRDPLHVAGNIDRQTRDVPGIDELPGDVIARQHNKDYATELFVRAVTTTTEGVKPLRGRSSRFSRGLSRMTLGKYKSINSMGKK